VVAVLVLAFAARAYSVRGSTSGIEHGYLKTISVRGLQLVRDRDDNATVGLFVGPVTADLFEAVSGPALTVGKSATPNLGDSSRGLVATGSGTTSTGAHCDVLIYRWRDGQQPSAVWKLSAEQVAGIESGRSEALEIAVGCPFST
jgi:hypothetical protein